jgi:hypothetical protein
MYDKVTYQCKTLNGVGGVPTSGVHTTVIVADRDFKKYQERTFLSFAPCMQSETIVGCFVCLSVSGIQTLNR